MKTNASKAPEGVDLSNILDLLALVAAKEFPYPLIEPNCDVQEGESVQGVITSETTKRLLTLKLWLKNAAETENAEADDASALKVHGFLDRSGLLDSLMWLSVRQEFPQEAVNGTALRSGWKLVGIAGKEWKDLTLFPSPKDLPNLILGQLLEASTGKLFPIETSDLGGVPDDLLGEKIGVILDPRARSLLAIERRFSRYAEDVATIEGVPMTKLDRKAIRAWMDKQIMGDIKRKAATLESIAELHVLLLELFWQAVKDTVPGAAQANGMAVCPDWELYEGSFGCGCGAIEKIVITSGSEIIPPDSELGRAILFIAHLHGKIPAGFGGRRERTPAQATEN